MKPAAEKPSWLLPLGLVLLTATIVAVLAVRGSLGYQQQSSKSHLADIANGMAAFSIEHHGELPARLSQLYPEFIENIDTFFIQPSEHASVSIPPEDELTARDIDLYSPYTLMASPYGSRAILFERSGLWADSSIACRQLTRPPGESHYHATKAGRVDGQEFAQMLGSYLSVDDSMRRQASASSR